MTLRIAAPVLNTICLLFAGKMKLNCSRTKTTLASTIHTLIIILITMFLDISGKLFRALMRKYGVLQSRPSRDSPPVTSETISLQSQSEINELPQFNGMLEAQWFLRYTSNLQSRGVATNRGYILLATQQ